MPADVPAGWTEKCVADIARVVGGSTPPSETRQFWNGAIPFVTPTDLTALGGRYLSATERAITDEGRKAAGLEVLPSGSVLLATRASIGRAALNEVPVTTNQGFQNLVPLDGTDSLWLYYAISQRQPDLARLAAGTTFRELSRKSLQGLDLLVPPPAEQRAIAAVLDAIEDAIERTEAVIAATEELRRALLHDLFARGVPGWHSEWKQVPGLGTMPACWEVERLGDVATVRNGTTPSRSRLEYWRDGDIPFVKTGRVNDIVIEEPDEFITSKAVRSAGAVVVPAGAVLIAMIGQGKTRGMSARLGFDAAINQNFAAVYDATEDIRLDYIFVWAYHSYSAIRNLGQGTNQDALNCELVEGMRVPLPPVAEQEVIATITSTAVERASSEARLLRELRGAKRVAADALLTGRARVPLVAEKRT